MSGAGLGSHVDYLTDCAGTTLPGYCGFPAILPAALACLSMPTCETVSMFEDGLFGVEGPLALVRQAR